MPKDRAWELTALDIEPLGPDLEAPDHKEPTEATKLARLQTDTGTQLHALNIAWDIPIFHSGPIQKGMVLTTNGRMVCHSKTIVI